MTFVSTNIREQLGYEPEAFLGNETFWMDRVHPDDRTALLANLQDLP